MKRRSLAIVGAGSSGLVTLKLALQHLPGWEVVCFEKSDRTIGCWGDPYPGFVSTSTKFTTQFSCYRKWAADADPARRPHRGDFFVGDEYGRYLEGFAGEFGLAPHIRLRTKVSRIRKDPDGWRLSLDDGGVREEVFGALVICSGLAEKAKAVESPVPLLKPEAAPVSGSRIVVMGGGESAADIAHRLAAPELRNEVFLSLKDGVRVSPRYHPVRGVPSDFLRNRLLLSIRRSVRNAIGRRFVEARIRHQERFERFFGSGREGEGAPVPQKRKYWDRKLSARAKDGLFNVFHTKSDDFLDDVAEDRIRIIGPPCGADHRRFHDFDRTTEIEVDPDYLCPRIGFAAGFGEILDERIGVGDFHLGCLHPVHDDLFLVGFARPIIGNIPTISEMQARLVIGTIAGRFPRPADIASLHAAERERREREFPTLRRDTIHPVEMIPYCDHLARLMGTYPTLRRLRSLRLWLKVRLSPASTTHYLDEDFDAAAIRTLPVHTPALIIGLLLMVKLLDLPFRLFGRMRSGSGEGAELSSPRCSPGVREPR